jgi:hypothetical protein
VRRVLVRILRLLGLLLAGALVAFVVAISLQIRIDLEPLRAPFEELASEFVGRPVTLEGEFFLVPTWSLVVEANGLRIANPEGWGGSGFARMERASFRFAVFPLLRRRLVVRELRAEGIDVRCVRREDGAANWAFGDDGADSAAARPEGGASPGAESSAEGAAGSRAKPTDGQDSRWQRFLPRAVAIRRLVFRDILWRFEDLAAGVLRESNVERVEGTVATDEPLELSVVGRMHGEPFEASLETGDADLLLAGQRAWPLRSVIEIPDARLTLEAQVDERDWHFSDALRFFLETARSPFAFLGHERLVALDVRLEGPRLDALEPVFSVALPDWGPVDLAGHFEIFGGGGFAADVVTKVGSSELSGRLDLELRADPPSFALVLEAPTVQLDDFSLEGWNALEGRPAAPAGAQGVDGVETARGLLSPEVMRSVEGRIEVDVGRVASGRDELGRGRLAAHVEDGRFRLDALDLEIPGGSIRTQASLTPHRRSVTGRLAVQVDRFDYGIFARRFVPETDMRGLFGMKVDLTSTAADPTRFVDHVSGRFDVAVFPEKLESGVIDLWAVNLLAAALPATDADKSSKINCLIARMQVRDGIMTEDMLLADTSRMTVHGKGEIDLRRRWVELDLRPVPKRPEFFSAATPIEVKGRFEQFDVDVDIDDLFGTVIRFVTSIVHVPLRRLFGHHESPGELDTCMAALERR